LLSSYTKDIKSEFLVWWNKVVKVHSEHLTGIFHGRNYKWHAYVGEEWMSCNSGSAVF
jgi:hypothetical protein